MITFTDVAVGDGAPLRCTRCHGQRGEAEFRPASEVVDAIGAVCAGWEGRPGPNVRLTGPEPFRNPALPQIVGGAAAAGCRRIAIETDAVALQSPQNAAGVLAAGVRHFHVGLLGATPGLHDALADAPGLFDATCVGVRTLRETATRQATAIDAVAVVRVCHHNVADLPALVGLAVELGFDRCVLAADDPGLDPAAAAQWVRAACDTGVVNGVWVEVEGLPFCMLEDRALHVSDVLRARCGAKAPACAACALDAWCGGATAGASPDQLSALRPPADVVDLAAGVARARAGGETS